MTQSRYLHRTRIPTMPTFQLLLSPAPLSGWLCRRLSGSLCKSDSLISNKWLPLRYHGRCSWLCCSTTACCYCRELPSDVRRWQICQTPSFLLLCQTPSFCYFALNTEMCWRALQAGRIYVRQHPHDAQGFFLLLCWHGCYSSVLSLFFSTETQRVYRHVRSGSPPPMPCIRLVNTMDRRLLFVLEGAWWPAYSTWYRRFVRGESYILPLSTFTCNSTSWPLHFLIAHNSNVRFARNVPFSQTRSHIHVHVHSYKCQSTPWKFFVRHFQINNAWGLM